jgi:hypothetical protein
VNISKEELSALIERVRGLKGPDREVNAAICIALQYGGPNSEDATNVRTDPDWDDGDLVFEIGNEDYCNPIPDLTGSIDAIRALTDRLLDGNNGRPLLYGRTSEWAAMALPEHQYTETLNFAVGEAPALKMLTVSERAETECAAALLALLLSLQSQEPTP